MNRTESHEKKKRRLEQLIEIINELVRFVEPFKPFLNSHNVQFLVEEHWQDEVLIRKEIRESLDEFISNEMSNHSTETKVNLIKYWLEFVRKDIAPMNCLEELFSKLNQLKTVWNEQVVCSNDLFDTESIGYERELEEKFNKMRKQNRFMNEKKSYEVDLMSKFVARLCNKLDIKTIVDIGSGKAYLSAQLSSPIFDSAFKVIAIDSVNSNVESSLKRLNIMKRKTTVFNHEMGKKCEKENKNNHNFQTFCEFIQSTSELNELIDAHVQSDSFGLNEKNFFAFVGLHSCGNLSNSIINLYLTNENRKEHKYRAKCLCNVACCYNLLNEKYATDEESSKDFKHTNVQIDDSSKFPMSKHLNQMRYALNFNARMLACHSLDRCLSSINDFKELENKALWYRSVLQCILLDLIKADSNNANVDMKSIQIGRKLISNEREFPSFVQYVRKALSKLELNSNNLTDEEIDKYFEKHKQMKQKFDVYIQLKQLIAPLVEYIILLDRLIFLFEHELDLVGKLQSSNDHNGSPKQEGYLSESCCYEHSIVKLFDPAKSPRCYALVSYLT